MYPYDHKAHVNLYAHWVWMTLEAMRDPAIAKQIITQDEYEDLREEWKKLAEDPEPVVIKFPDVWVMGVLASV